MSASKGSPALNDLLSKYGETEPTFDVVLNDGSKLVFRSLASYRSLRDLMAGADEWIATVKKAAPAEMRPYVKATDDDTLRKVYELSSLTVSPELSQLDWLILAEKAGALFLAVYSQVLARVDPDQRAKMREEVEEKKAPSSKTSNGETP